jgi:phosphoserine phosphatase
MTTNKKPNKQIKAVILDLDQTITTDQASWLQFTTLIGADPNVHEFIYKRFKKGELPYEKAKKQLIKHWRKYSSLKKDKLIKTFKKIEVRQNAEEAITYLNNKYKVCIISGAIDMFVQVFSKRFEIDDWYASTKFVFNKHENLIDFDYMLSRGEEKVGFLRQFCKKHNLSVNECAAIGDGDSDMPIFAKVRLPILFIAQETSQENKRAIQNHLTKWEEIYELL